MGKVRNILTVVILLWLLAFIVSKAVDIPDFEDKIALIPIKGAISSEDLVVPGFGRSFASSDVIVEFLDEASKDKTVRGIMLEINSPGGTVVASKEIVDKVKSIDKPVVAYIREIGTSGAYWIASAADRVIADELSLTGSIGVVSSYLEFAGLIEDFNVTYRGLKTGKYKDIGSPFRELTMEEQRILQEKLDKIHDYFVEDVAMNRNLDKSSVEQAANGLFYLGNEAKELGLIDEFGNKEVAFNVTKELANVTEAKIVKMEKKRTIFDVLTSVQSGLSLGNSMLENENLVYAR